MAGGFQDANGNPKRRVSFIMVDEGTYDNLVYVKDNLIKQFKQDPEDIGEVINALVKFWFEGKRD
jgi:hypothetical protein